MEDIKDIKNIKDFKDVIVKTEHARPNILYINVYGLMAPIKFNSYTQLHDYLKNEGLLYELFSLESTLYIRIVDQGYHKNIKDIAEVFCMLETLGSNLRHSDMFKWEDKIFDFSDSED